MNIDLFIESSKVSHREALLRTSYLLHECNEESIAYLYTIPKMRKQLEEVSYLLETDIEFVTVAAKLQEAAPQWLARAAQGVSKALPIAGSVAGAVGGAALGAGLGGVGAVATGIGGRAAGAKLGQVAGNKLNAWASKQLSPQQVDSKQMTWGDLITAAKNNNAIALDYIKKLASTDQYGANIRTWAKQNGLTLAEKTTRSSDFISIPRLQEGPPPGLNWDKAMATADAQPVQSFVGGQQVATPTGATIEAPVLPPALGGPVAGAPQVTSQPMDTGAYGYSRPPQGYDPQDPSNPLASPAASNPVIASPENSEIPAPLGLDEVRPLELAPTVGVDPNELAVTISSPPTHVATSGGHDPDDPNFQRTEASNVQQAIQVAAQTPELGIAIAALGAFAALAGIAGGGYALYKARQNKQMQNTLQFTGADARNMLKSTCTSVLKTLQAVRREDRPEAIETGLKSIGKLFYMVNGEQRTLHDFATLKAAASDLPQVTTFNLGPA